MKKGLIIGSCITLTIVLITGSWFIHLSNQMKWHVHEPVTQEQQVRFSNMAFLPSFSGIWERYADRGLRDTEYMTESRLYKDRAEMTGELPEICKPYIEETFRSESEEAKDIKGVTVRRYTVTEFPAAKREELDPQYEHYSFENHVYYYILEYEDGSCRFAADIHNT